MSDRAEIWAAVPTPFLPDLEIDEEGLRLNVRRYKALKLKGIFCNGLMGEVWSVSAAERRRILEITIDEAGGDLEVSVVVSGGHIGETLDLAAHAAKTGATHAVVMVPTSGPRSDEQMLAYFRHIHDRLDLPLVIFNASTAAGSPLSPDVLGELCALPRFKILKTTAYAQNATLRKAACNGVIVSDPLEEHFLANHIEHGQPILYSDPEPYLYQTPGHRPIADYVEHLARGEFDAAKKKFEQLAPLRAVFNKWIMDPLIRGHMPNAALKRWCEMVGMRGGTVRAPVSALSAAQENELGADLAACS